MDLTELLTQSPMAGGIIVVIVLFLRSQRATARASAEAAAQRDNLFVNAIRARDEEFGKMTARCENVQDCAQKTIQNAMTENSRALGENSEALRLVNRQLVKMNGSD